MATNRLSVVDYVVFALVLAISGGIGIYYAFKQRKSSTTDFLLGGRSMSILPVTLSLTASFMSAITLLGTPAEIYVFTTIYIWIVFGFMIAIPTAAHVYVPIFYNLKLTSIFEYIQIRFGTALRLAIVIIYIIQIVLYTGIVLYAPSLALEAVTGLNVWLSVLSVGVVCTFYTTIGGMKAVLWTDAFQMAVMFIGLIAILVQGTIDNNGFGNIWNDLKESGRVEWFNFDPNPTVRHTNWGLVIGGTFLWLPVYAANQAQIQRALSLPTLGKAKLAYWISVPLLVGLTIVCGCCGMVCYSQYKDCDPLSTKEISSRDQILPLYVMDKLSYLKGIPGLFIASLFSGTLSTISSSLNSLSAVTLEDLIRPYCCPKITDARASLITKIMAVVYGAICIGVTFVAAQLGGVLQAAISLFGMIGGPQLGVFTLGILFPFVNHIGAFVGFFTGLIVIFWIGIGAQIYKRYNIVFPSPVSTAGCPVENATLWNSTTLWTSQMTEYTTGSQWTTPMAEMSEKSGFVPVYTVSYLWLGVISTLTVCIVGIIVSLIVDCIIKPDPKRKVDPRLTFPLLSKLMPCLPKGAKRFLSCYVDYDQENELDEKKSSQDKQEDLMRKKSLNGVTNTAYQPDSEKSFDAMRTGETHRRYRHPMSQISYV